MTTSDHKANAKNWATSASISNVTSANTFSGPPPEGTDPVCQWFLGGAGVAPISHIGGADTDWQEGLQCIVRGDRYAYDELDTRARALRAALHQNADARADGYTQVLARGSIVELAPDDEGRPRLSFNLILRIRE